MKIIGKRFIYRKYKKSASQSLENKMVVLKRTVEWTCWARCLAAETVESAALSLQSIYDVHGGNSLALGVFGVGDGITDDILKEDLQDATSFLVDETRDTLDTSTASQTTDGRLCDSLKRIN